MGSSVEFLGDLIAFITSFLTTNFVFGLSILQIWFVPVLIGLVLSLILGRARIYRNASTRYEASQKAKMNYKAKHSAKKG